MQSRSIEEQVSAVIDALQSAGVDLSGDTHLVSTIGLIQFARHPFHPAAARSAVLDYLRTLPGFDEALDWNEQPLSVAEAHGAFYKVAKRRLDPQ